MTESSVAQIFKRTTKLDRDPKEDKIDKLCKQFENLHLMMMKQPREAQKQAEAVCYNCGKKGYYASQCRMQQESRCYKCGRKGDRASECRSKVDMPPTSKYCHRVSHTVENCFDKRNNESVERQDVRFANNGETTENKGAGPSGQNNTMLVKEDDPVEEENPVTAFRKTANGETITK